MDETPEEFKRRIAMEMAVKSFIGGDTNETLTTRAEEFYKFLSKDDPDLIEIETVWASPQGVHIATESETISISWSDINLLPSSAKETHAAIDHWLKQTMKPQVQRHKRK